MNKIQKLQFRFIVTRFFQISMFYIVDKNASFCLHCLIDLYGNSVQIFKSLFVSESWVWLSEISTVTISFLYLLPSIVVSDFENYQSHKWNYSSSGSAQVAKIKGYMTVLRSCEEKNWRFSFQKIECACKSKPSGSKWKLALYQDRLNLLQGGYLILPLSPCDILFKKVILFNFPALFKEWSI